jgi:uncharacterized protein with ParB-like and HNH nuclease domain
MIKDASKTQVHQIFSVEDSIKYVVPKYQREYKWGFTYWEQLINDLDENAIGYFIGPIICISREKHALRLPRPLEIIDGQQRLISISLLYAAIYNRFLEEGENNDIAFNSEKFNLMHRLVQKRDKINGQLKLQPTKQNGNLKIYEWILHELGIYNSSNLMKPKNLGNRRLYKAYNYFKDNFIKMDDIKEVQSFLFKLNQAWFVVIQVENYSDAFMLFESLNNRGMPLTAMELIKSKLISKIEKKISGSIKSTFDLWQNVLKNLESPENAENYIIQQRFLRQYYNAFRYKDNIRMKGIPKATKSNLIKIYETLIKNDPNFMLKEFIEKSKIYNQFVNLDNEETPEILKSKFRDLLNIGGAPSYTLLLYLISEYGYSDRLIEGVLNFLIKYFVRRNLTDDPSTRKLDQIFIDTIIFCESCGDKIDTKLITNYLTQPERFAPSEEFIKELNGNIYDTNTQVARFILTKIEEKYFTQENYKNLWNKAHKKLVWSIEHILPKGEKLNDSWVEMIADGDKIKALELKRAYTHKLGNLTLTAYNPNLSNSDFLTKRDKKDDKGTPIGFNNGLYLNKELENKNRWRIKDIQDRTQKLVNEALELFEIKK